MQELPIGLLATCLMAWFVEGLWWTGGGPAGAKHDKIQKFSFASGTDAVDISNLIGTAYQSAGCQY